VKLLEGVTKLEHCNKIIMTIFFLGPVVASLDIANERLRSLLKEAIWWPKNQEGMESHGFVSPFLVHGVHSKHILSQNTFWARSGTIKLLHLVYLKRNGMDYELVSWNARIGRSSQPKSISKCIGKVSGHLHGQAKLFSVLSSANLTLWALKMVYLNLRTNKKMERLIRPILRPAGPQHLPPTRKTSPLQIQWSH
jgi:hypothetical protein